MKNSTMLVIVGIIIISVIAFMIVSTKESNSDITGNNIKNEDVQKIILSMKNSNYYPNTITVKQGIPVEITLDESVRGCYRSFTIRDLNVAEYSRSPAETIDFTPDKKGTFRFSCSMGMGTGTIIVTETGKASEAEIESAKAAAANSANRGSCGSGGCGCGG